jgi:hypothetical protein
VPRIGLLHTVTFPYSVRYWYDCVDWKFELKYEHGVPVGHDAFVQHTVEQGYDLSKEYAKLAVTGASPSPSRLRRALPDQHRRAHETTAAQHAM